MIRVVPRFALALTALLGVASSPAAQDWGNVATVSSTMGVHNGRVCTGTGSRGDIGCGLAAPYVDRVTGRVGIGTANPQATLHVVPTLDESQATRIGGISGTDVIALVPGSTFGSLWEGASTGHAFVGIRDNDANDAFVVMSGGGDYNSNPTYDKLVLYARATGQVGIGTSAPLAPLHVNGGLVVTGPVTGTALISTTSGGIVSATYGYFRYISGTHIHGTFSGDGSALTGITADATDRIVSGTTRVVVNANTGYTSFTAGGVTTGFYSPGGIFSSVGISTTGGISTTYLNLARNGAGLLNGRILMGGTRFLHRFFPTGADGYNTFLGLNSGNSSMAISGNSQHASYNTGVGEESLSSLSTGNRNTAMGAMAASSLSSGQENTAIGYQAMYQATTASGNTGVGKGALFSTTSATYNTAVGQDAASYGTSGSENTAVGAFALLQNTVGNQNTAVGAMAMYNATSGTQNTALGKNALYHNQGGSQNVAVGVSALSENRSGSYNTALGTGALYNNLTGSGNSAFGISTLYQNTGNNNIAMGNQALHYKGAGSDNVAIGYNAGRGSGTPTQERNTAIGSGAGYAMTTAEDNVFLGYNAGHTTTTGDRNILLGSGATAPSPATSDYLNIGNVITGNMAADGSLTLARNTSVTGHVSVTGNVSANRFIGDGSGLTGVTAAATDRIVSGSTQVVVNANTGYTSFTAGGVTTGFYSPGGIFSAVGISTSTNQASFTTVYASGRVGIGTATPTTALEAVGELRSTDGSVRTFLQSSQANGGYVGTRSNDRLVFRTNDTDRAFILPNGNFGIRTVVPDTALAVTGAISATNIYVTSTVAGDGVVSGTYGYFRYISGTQVYGRFFGDGSGLTGITADATDRITSGTTNVVANANTGYVSFTSGGTTTGFYSPGGVFSAVGISTSSNQASFTTVYASGNVGIGTNNPQAALHVSGSVPRFRLQHDGGASYFEISEMNAGQGVIRQQFAGATDALIDINPIPSNGTSAAYVRLFRETSTTGARALSILRGDGTTSAQSRLSAAGHSYLNAIDGNVGIRTTNPREALYINKAIGLHDGEPSGSDFTGIVFNTYWDPGTATQRYAGFASGNRYAGVMDFNTQDGLIKLWSSGGPGAAGAAITPHNSYFMINSPMASAGVDGGGAATDSALFVNANQGHHGYTGYLKGFKARWHVGADNGSETGSNAGSDFFIHRFDDDGGFLGRAFTILRNNGNVGIGTHVPTTKLEVTGVVSATQFRGDGSLLTGVTAPPAGVSGSIQFNNGAGGMAGRADVVVDANGRVGIGTASTTNPLNVYGTTNFQARFRSGSNEAGIGADPNGFFRIVGTVGGALGYGSASHNTFTEVMRVVPSGVGIGTEVPTASLEVVGMISTTSISATRVQVNAAASGPCSGAGDRGRIQMNAATGALQVCLNR